MPPEDQAAQERLRESSKLETAAPPAPVAKINLPVVQSWPLQKLNRRRWVQIGALVVVGGVMAIAGIYWWNQTRAQLPAGIVFSNGRIEADEIDIDSKFAGRIAALLADEGDMVAAGQVVARMDTRDLAASLKKSEAQVQLAQRAIEEASANVAQQSSQVVLAKQEMERTAALVQKGFATKQVLDQRQQQLDGANAALNAAQVRVIEAEHSLEASTHDVELYRVNIADNSLVAPRDGRIQYRIANIGEVVPAGGKVLSMIDIASVYMDIYLPTADAGRIKAGGDARIVLDAYPNLPIPAKVSFIATQAQFTPKAVETKTERDKLMFRVRVRIDPELLRQHAADVRSGLPGLAYVRLDPAVAWPERLQGKLTQ